MSVADPTREDSHNRQALRYLAVVCGATVVAWFAATIGCNRRERPVPPPLPVELAVLRGSPKAVALEFQQRVVGGEWDVAAELLAPGVAGLVEQARAGCSERALPCATRAELVTRADLLSSDGARAQVRAETFLGTRLLERSTMDVESVEGQWRVVARRIETL